MFFLILFFVFIFLQLNSGSISIEVTFIVFLYLTITSFAKNFRIRYDMIFAPQNVAFSVFFIRLYLLPMMGIYYDYRNVIDTRDIDKDVIFSSYLITLVMYLAFIIGWEVNIRRTKKKITYNYTLNSNTIKWVSIFFLSIGLLTIINIISDFQGYIKTIILNKSEDIEVNGNIFVDLLLSISKYFLPFVIFGILSSIDIKSKSKISKNFILLISIFLVLIVALNSNRQSMLYPILALIVGFSKYIRFKPLPVVFFGLLVLYISFNFTNFRDRNESNHSLRKTETIINDIQIYAGGAQIIAPVFKYDGFKYTIFNSFISSFPVLGTPYRAESGNIIYNYLFYGFYGVADQVFLTQAECYLNGGYLLVFVFFIMVGFYYSKLNRFFFNTLNSQFLFVVTLYYFILLFNSTILLSFQVMGQFLFYNSLPALILFKLYKNKNKNHDFVEINVKN